MSFWLSLALIHTGDTLRGNTGPRYFSCFHQFCVKDYGFICLGCLVLWQPLTEGVLRHVICMLIPSQGVWRKGSSSMTATGPTLDSVRPVCCSVSAPLTITDKPEPGADRPGLWGAAEPRCCSDPCALLHVVYLQVLAPAQK